MSISNHATRLFFSTLGWNLILNKKECPFQNLQVVLTVSEQDLRIELFALEKKVTFGDGSKAFG